jgi:hypothetical protein
MNRWSQEGNYIEGQRSWVDGRAFSAIAASQHGDNLPQFSIHPHGRPAEYKYKNRQRRYAREAI